MNNDGLKEKQEKAVWELTGRWKSVDPTPDFKTRFMSKINEPARPVQPEQHFKKWFSWDWDWREIFIPASAFAAMLIVVGSFLVWSPYENQNHTVEIASAIDLLENKELLTDMDLLSDLDLLMIIDPAELKNS